MTWLGDGEFEEHPETFAADGALAVGTRVRAPLTVPVVYDLATGEDGDFEYRELGEEGHASTDQDQKLRMFRLLDDFLQRRLDVEAAD